MVIFHAGTQSGDAGRVLTSGGRVLAVVGRAPTYADAITRAYSGVKQIAFEGAEYRNDIGQKAR